MKLQTKTSETGKKTKEKCAVKHRAKKKIGLKLSKNRDSFEPYRAIRAEVELSRLTYGMIRSHKLEGIVIDGETIQFDKSWVELVIFMIANVMENHPDDFLDLLAQNNVTHQGFIVDKVFGKYEFTEDRQYKVYKVYNTDYFVEAVFDEANIFSAIVGLITICDIAVENLRFMVVSNRFLEKQIDFDLIDDNETILMISGLSGIKLSDWQLMEISIYGERVGVHDFLGVLWVFCKCMLSVYNAEILLKLPKNKNTGILKRITREEVEFMQLDENLFIYTNKNEKDIIKFLKSAINNLGISEENLKFKFKKIKGTL